MAELDRIFLEEQGKPGPAAGGATADAIALLSAISREQALATLAKRQHGVVARRQLLELGVGSGAVEYRLRTGRLHRIHPGVYSVGHPIIAAPGRWMAAVLACGSAALLSHQSAAALWEIRPNPSGVVHVIAERTRGRPAIAVHRARGLDSTDHTSRRGIPVTSLARTLLDLALVLQPQQLERALEEAERLRILDLRAVQRLCDRSRGHRGRRTLLSLLGSEPPPETRSELERRFLDLCGAVGLPEPAVNVIVAGFEVDAVWPGGRLVVELDGHAYHRTPAAFERDRRRDTALQLAGYRVIRVTHRRLEKEPAAIVDAVRTLLGSAADD